MKRVLAGALTLVLCCATWLAAADSDQKKPVSKQAAANSARQFKQMQAQLKQQQEQIAKLLAQLDQNRKALEEAQQKVGASAQQTQQQAVATEQKANSLNDQLMGMQSAGGVVDEKPHNK